MKVSQVAQRELRPSHVNKIIVEFDVEKLGVLTVNYRDGHYYVVDGQHRLEALRSIGWGDQQLECATYAGLSEDQEAELFLQLNAVLAVNTYAKYQVGVAAGRREDVHIRDILAEHGLKITSDSNTQGAVHCVATLKRLYRATGPANLDRTLAVVHTSYGDLGMKATIVGGIGRVLDRYGSDIDDASLIQRLSTVPGGLNALTSRAQQTRQLSSCPAEHAVAVACVQLINTSKGMHRRIRSWWDDSQQPARAHLVAS
jgi:hypothetical protein